MIVSNKIKTIKIFINLILLIFIYFFSFHFFPKVNLYNKLDFVGIKVIDRTVFLFDEFNNLVYDNDEKTSKYINKFLIDYFTYLNQNQNILAHAPCPGELLANNLRNIQILGDDKKFWQKYFYSFDVRFSFYKFPEFNDKLDLNKCFDYIFKENLNKFYLVYRDKKIQDFEVRINYSLNYNNITEIKKLPFSSFIREVEKGNIVSVVIIGNIIEVVFSDGEKFLTYSPVYPNLVEKLSSNGVDISVELDLVNDVNRTIQANAILYGNSIALLENIDFFVDPNVSYSAIYQPEKNSSKILIFIICILIVISVNYGYKKTDKKQISKFFNRFINT